MKLFYNNPIVSKQVSIVHYPLVVFSIWFVKRQKLSIQKTVKFFIFPFQFVNLLPANNFFYGFRKSHCSTLGGFVDFFRSWAKTLFAHIIPFFEGDLAIKTTFLLFKYLSTANRICSETLIPFFDKLCNSLICFSDRYILNRSIHTLYIHHNSCQENLQPTTI